MEASGSYQYVFPNDCALEAMRTQVISTAVVDGVHSLLPQSVMIRTYGTYKTYKSYKSHKTHKSYKSYL
jgi:hypothetical protein